MKEFDLENALAGEPVKLRDGQKAYVVYRLQNAWNPFDELQGYICPKDGDFSKEGNFPESWDITGKQPKNTENLDIVEMWDKPDTVKIACFEFQKPVSRPLKDGTTYYFVNLNVCSDRLVTAVKTEWDSNIFDTTRLKNGMVHLNRSAAEQHAKVLAAISLGKTSLDD